MFTKLKDDNGYELDRLIRRGKDVVHAMTKWDMKSSVLNMSSPQCITLAATKELVTELEASEKEYFSCSNEHIGDEDMARTLWKGMDPATQDLALVLRSDQDSTFEALSNDIESRFTAHTYRTSNNTKARLDVVAMGKGAGIEQPTWDPWAGAVANPQSYSADGGDGAWAQYGSPSAEPQPYVPSLDAFGNGGKRREGRQDTSPMLSLQWRRSSNAFVPLAGT